MPSEQLPFDEGQARDLVEALHEITGLGCTLFLPEGDADARIAASFGACDKMCYRSKRGSETFWGPICRATHCVAARLSDSFGGRYFYLCREDRIFAVAPIVSVEGLAAAVCIGPVHIFEEDENELHGEGFESFPVRTPQYVHHVSTILSMAAVSVSDASQSVLRLTRREELLQQADINRFIRLGRDGSTKRYPLEVEHELSDAIARGDFASASSALNALIGLFMSSPLIGKGFTLHSRAYELVSVITRSGMEAGALDSQMFTLSERYMTAIAQAAGNVRISKLLLDLLDEVVEKVVRLERADYDDASYRTVEYIRSNYGKRITLSEVANVMGFSPTYFSKNFKKRFGCTFSTYLNQVRIRASKSLLLTTDESIAAIAEKVGFDDPGYFARVFKKLSGVTPGYYRSHRGRIVRDRERLSENARKKSQD